MVQHTFHKPLKLSRFNNYVKAPTLPGQPHGGPNAQVVGSLTHSALVVERGGFSAALLSFIMSYKLLRIIHFVEASYLGAQGTCRAAGTRGEAPSARRSAHSAAAAVDCSAA